MPKHGKFGGFSKEKRGFCQMVASAGWKTGWVEVEGGQNVVRALGWWQSVLGISNTAASTQIPTAALETRSCPITMDTTFPTKGNLQLERNPTSQQRIPAEERRCATDHCAGQGLGMDY